MGIDFWRFFPFIIIVTSYYIYLLLTIQGPGDLLKVSSITLKWPTYFPLAGLGFMIVLYIRYVINGRSFSTLIKHSFSFVRNKVKNWVQQDLIGIVTVIFLWLAWAYHSFVYMGITLFHEASGSIPGSIHLFALLFISVSYKIFATYCQYKAQRGIRNFPIFVAVLYSFNEVAFRMSILGAYCSRFLTLGANARSFLTMGSHLMAFIINHPIYSIAGLFAIFLLKILYNQRRNN